MKKTLNFIKDKGKIIIMPVVIIIVLLAIYIFNGLQKNGSAIVYAETGTYIEASGTVESNGISISSEVAGIVTKRFVNEGDSVDSGDVIVVIENTNLKNQYDQSLINYQLAENNIALLENNIINLTAQNQDATTQAHNAYLAAEAEYQKVMDGANPDEIRVVEETVSQAKINLEYMETNLNRSKELYLEEAISRSQYDEALKNYNVGLAQYNTAVSQLNLLKSYPTETSSATAENRMLQAKAGYKHSISNGNTQLTQQKNQLEIAKIQLEQSKNIVEQNKRELEKLTIKAPIDGVVNSLLINEGELLTMGKLVAEIYDFNNVRVKAYISEANIGHVTAGQSAYIYVDSHGDSTFEGKVLRVNNKAEFTPKNIQTKEERVNTVFEVTIEALNSKGVIKPGMPVDINIKID